MKFVITQLIKKAIKNFIVKIDKRLPNSLFYTFVMSPKEKKLFDEMVRNSAVYLEFGMGGSTFRTLQKSKAIIYSADSSKDWIFRMREYRQIRMQESKRKLFLFHVDIGPTGEWGRPIDNDKKDKFDCFPLYNKEPK